MRLNIFSFMEMVKYFHMSYYTSHAVSVAAAEDDKGCRMVRVLQTLCSLPGLTLDIISAVGPSSSASGCCLLLTATCHRKKTSRRSHFEKATLVKTAITAYLVILSERLYQSSVLCRCTAM